MSDEPGALMRAHRAVEFVLRPLEVAAAIVAGVLLIATMLLTSADALLRYGFDAPISWNYYLTENYLLVGILCMPLAWGYRAGGYIRLISLANALPRSARSMLLRAGMLAGSAYIIILAWLALEKFIENYQANAIDMGVWDWRVAWSWFFVPVGLGLFALRLISTALGPESELHQSEEDAEIAK